MAGYIMLLYNGTKQEHVEKSSGPRIDRCGTAEEVFLSAHFELPMGTEKLLSFK